MELELGLKLAKADDDFASYFQFSKDRGGSVFKSTETGSVFILTAHLKGYERKNIRIDINEDGTVIGISGKRPIREILTVGSKVYKKDEEAFNKVFRIPDGVVLDKIRASYNEDESTLKVTMPKKVRGIRGTNIEEIKEERGDDLLKEGSSHLQIGDENAKNSLIEGTSNQEKNEEEKKDNEADKKDVHENDSRARDNENGIHEEEENEGPVSAEHEKVLNEDHNTTKGSKLCLPLVAAGSTLLLSIVVFVLHIIRSKNQNSAKRD